MTSSPVINIIVEETDKDSNILKKIPINNEIDDKDYENTASENIYDNNIEETTQTQPTGVFRLLRNQSEETELVPTVDWEPQNENSEKCLYRQLPPGIWRIVSSLLGVEPGRRPIIGTIAHVITVGLAISFVVLHSWFEVYNIISMKTKQTTMKGLLSIVLSVFWASLGCYSHFMSGRLITAPAIAQSVRMHSKTIFKLSSAVILSIISISALTINLKSAFKQRTSENCMTVGLPKLLCSFLFYIRCLFGGINVFWNLLVATIVLSVCRTLTLDLRFFIKDMEEDGHNFEIKKRQKIHLDKKVTRLNNTDFIDSLKVTDAFNIIDNDLGEEERTLRYRYSQMTPPCQSSLKAINRHNNKKKQRHCWSSDINEEKSDEEQQEHQRQKSHDESHEALLQCSIGNVSVAGLKRILPSGTEVVNTMNTNTNCNSYSRQRLTSDMSTSTQYGTTEASQEFIQSAMINLISNEEILLRHWKLSSRLRAASLCFQRWFTAWICFIVIHCSTYVIYWISHSVTLMDIADFFLPILLLPILTGSYAEVNMEGRRFIKSICPTENRMSLMYYIIQNRLEITAFGWAINYSTIVKSLGALLIALASRLILDDMKTS